MVVVGLHALADVISGKYIFVPIK